MTLYLIITGFILMLYSGFSAVIMTHEEDKLRMTIEWNFPFTSIVAFCLFGGSALLVGGVAIAIVQFVFKMG